MRVKTTTILAATMLLSTISSASALTWICPVPEIDGPAGLAAIAALASICMMAYDRIKG